MPINPQLMEALKNATVHNRNSAALVAAARDKDLVILFGDTKAGKSSLVHHLMGNQLVATRDTETDDIVLKAIDPACGPVIGHSPVSQTTSPTKWTIPGSSLEVWDTPGFNDNRGLVQEAANSFQNMLLAKCARSAKFVFVSDLSALSAGDGRLFREFVSNIAKTFPDTTAPSFLQGVSLVFTKVSSDYDVPRIWRLLERKILNPEIEMSANAKGFIEYFRTHQMDSIGIFKDAKGVVGDIAQGVDMEVPVSIGDGITDLIVRLPHVSRADLQQLRCSISSELREALISTQLEASGILQRKAALDSDLSRAEAAKEKAEHDKTKAEFTASDFFKGAALGAVCGGTIPAAFKGAAAAGIPLRVGFVEVAKRGFGEAAQKTLEFTIGWGKDIAGVSMKGVLVGPILTYVGVGLATVGAIGGVNEVYNESREATQRAQQRIDANAARVTEKEEEIGQIREQVREAQSTKDFIEKLLNNVAVYVAGEHLIDDVHLAGGAAAAAAVDQGDHV